MTAFRTETPWPIASLIAWPKLTRGNDEPEKIIDVRSGREIRPLALLQRRGSVDNVHGTGLIHAATILRHSH